MLRKYDKNGDGKLSKQNALRFADKNGDGYINEDEISEFVQYASKWGFRIS